MEKTKHNLPGLVDLRENPNSEVNPTSKENKKFIEKYGTKIKFSDGFLMCYIGGDWFLISRFGDVKLLLCFSLFGQGSKKWVKPIRYIHVTKGIQIGKDKSGGKIC